MLLKCYEHPMNILWKSNVNAIEILLKCYDNHVNILQILWKNTNKIQAHTFLIKENHNLHERRPILFKSLYKITNKYVSKLSDIENTIQTNNFENQGEQLTNKKEGEGEGGQQHILFNHVKITLKSNENLWKSCENPMNTPWRSWWHPMKIICKCYRNAIKILWTSYENHMFMLSKSY